MKLKVQNNCITISYKYKNYPHCSLKTCFIIKAADIDKEKALKVAEILFPDCEIKVDCIKNDELTLTYEDYKTLHTMVNDKLVNCIKETKTPYSIISDPLDLKYKRLLEKMSARMNQFQHASCY